MREPIPFGRYWLLDRIAIGGMAEVFVAARRDGGDARPCAVKRILPTLAEDEELLTMFLDEARLVAQLDHPGISPILELGKIGEAYFIALEYVAGKDLRALSARLRAKGERLPVPLVAYLGWRVADALDHAHRKRDAAGTPLRIVHRDVSPANVLVGFDGGVRVIDFGIAEASIRTRRRAGVLRGKFAYMSPEMVRGLPVDRRSDVFALGVVLHELLTGERLFAGPSELAVMEKVRAADVPSPSARNPAVPEALSSVIMKALAREPEGRWAWASELRDALVPWTHAGSPPGEPPAMARLMARCFPAELRAELDRLERAQALPKGVVDDLLPHEPTKQVVVPPGFEPGAVPAQARDAVPGPVAPLPDASPAAGPAARPAAPRVGRVRRRAAVLASVLFLALAGGTTFALRAGLASAIGEPGPAQGRLVVQATSAAELYLDGAHRAPSLEAGEARALFVPTGPHRIELRTADGRRASATVQVREGETAELLAVELE
ncbi:MAG: serine/threonine-protein kinase [Anaeromyxobacter sp.]